MKKWLTKFGLLLFWPLTVMAQTIPTTPNLGLPLIPDGYQNWGVPYRLAQNILDSSANTWKGAWNGTTTYTVGQFVSFSGSIYISTIANNLNNTPSGGTGWVLFTTAASGGFTLGSTAIALGGTFTSVAGLTVDGVSPTTFGFLDATSSIQTQLNGKAPLLPSGTTNQLLYYASNGTTLTPLNLGTNLSITSGTLNAAGAGGSGFPITLGATSIASGSTTTAVTGLSVNGVTINGAGSSTLFLNQAGGYTAPAGGGIVNTIGINTANGVSGTSSGGANPLLTVVLGAITPSQVTTGFVTTTGNAACSGCGGGDTLTEGVAPGGSFIGAGLDTYWADSGTHHIAANLNNAGTTYIPVVPGGLTPGDVYVVGANGIDPVDGGAFPGTGISGGVSGFIPLFGGATTITASSHLDDGVTAAGIISSSEPIAVSSASLPPGVIITPNGVAPAAPSAGFMWGVPTSIATPYTATVPNAAPTAGNTFLSCTAANPSVCSWTSAAGGTPAYPLTISGGVSGGVVYGSSATQLTVAPAGTANVLMKWGGAGAAPANSSITDAGTTVISTEGIESSLAGTVTAANIGVGSANTGFYSAAPTTNLDVVLNGTQIEHMGTGAMFLKTQALCYGSSFTATSVCLDISSANSYLNLNNSASLSNAPAVGIASTFDYHNIATVASAATIAPAGEIFSLSGTTTVTTITNPAALSTTLGACIFIMPTGAGGFGTGGNIANAITTSAGTLVEGCWNGTAWVMSNVGPGSTGTTTIASGTSALGTSAIASGACATVVTTTATGTASTDAISWNPNASIKAVTGYTPSTSGGLTIASYPTSGNVNFDVCNWSSASITPGAVTLNWRVVR
jgi:hypothetical protein